MAAQTVAPVPVRRRPGHRAPGRHRIGGTPRPAPRSGTTVPRPWTAWRVPTPGPFSGPAGHPRHGPEATSPGAPLASAIAPNCRHLPRRAPPPGGQHRASSSPRDRMIPPKLMSFIRLLVSDGADEPALPPPGAFGSPRAPFPGAFLAAVLPGETGGHFGMTCLTGVTARPAPQAGSPATGRSGLAEDHRASPGGETAPDGVLATDAEGARTIQRRRAVAAGVRARRTARVAPRASPLTTPRGETDTPARCRAPS